MSFYAMMFGENPAAAIAMAVAGLTKGQVGRYRDAWLEIEDGQVLVRVHTRNGGGNREHWDESTEPGWKCRCTGCTMEYAIPKLPGYIRDEDDDYDCTYADVWFRPLPEYADLLTPAAVEIIQGSSGGGDIGTRWQEMIRGLGDGTAEVAHPEAMAGLVEKLRTVLGGHALAGGSSSQEGEPPA